MIRPAPLTLTQRLRQRVATWLAPAAAPRSAVRRFEAARVDRLTAGWMATSNSLAEELRQDLDRLRSRGRELVKNNDYARKFVGMCQDNIVGPDGIRLQARVVGTPSDATAPDRLANAAIEAAWAEWSKGCDVTGTQSLRDVCATLIGGMPSDGELLVRLITGPAAGNKWGFALQPLDVDRIDTTYNDARLTNGNSVRLGIEMDGYSRPVAVHLFAGHPSDGAASNRQRERVPVTDIIHRFQVQTPGQPRGIPWMAPGMLSLHHLGAFKLAALLAAEHGANHFGFFTSPEGATPFGAEDETGQVIATSQPGTFDTLPAGVAFQAFESRYPNEVFSPFVKTTLQRIASGWRVAYHSLANDLEGVSYSSIRSGTLEERDRWAADQAWFVNAVLEPIYDAWLLAALTMGAITMPNGSALPAAKREKLRARQWQPRRWDWVDPLKDMQAKVLGVRAGLIAPQDLAAQMGTDFDDVLGKLKDAHDQAAALGITLSAYNDGSVGLSAGLGAAAGNDGAAQITD